MGLENLVSLQQYLDQFIDLIMNYNFFSTLVAHQAFLLADSTVVHSV